MRFFPCISIILFFKRDGVFRERIPDAATVSVELSRKEKLSALPIRMGLHDVHLFKDAALFLTVDEVFVAHADVRAWADVAVQARANLRLTERKSKLVRMGVSLRTFKSSHPS